MLSRFFVNMPEEIQEYLTENTIFRSPTSEGMFYYFSILVPESKKSIMQKFVRDLHKSRYFLFTDPVVYKEKVGVIYVAPYFKEEDRNGELFYRLDLPFVVLSPRKWGFFAFLFVTGAVVLNLPSYLDLILNKPYGLVAIFIAFISLLITYSIVITSLSLVRAIEDLKINSRINST